MKLTYQNIYVPVDNSDDSNKAIDMAVAIASAQRAANQDPEAPPATLVGSHVYAAKMHDVRFKQMEYTLPEEYQEENELERQRKIHDTLITRGLQLISDSYLRVMQEKAILADLPFEPVMLDGKNFSSLVTDIQDKAYDLVILGAQGMGATKDSLIGSVTERVVRRVRSDCIVTKNSAPAFEEGGNIVVAVDGSPQSFAGLKVGMELGRVLNRTVEAVAVYDPYLHYSMFNGIVTVLSEEASKVFRFKEQEKLHEEIIDTGLAKIYQSHLEIARKIAAEEGVDLKITLLDGKAFERIIQFVRKTRPWLLILGRIGVHSGEDMDIGACTENLLRLASCHVMLISQKYYPPIDVKAEETISWTEEANVRMEKVPAMVRAIARTAILRYAMERGHSIISSQIIDAAVGTILPEAAIRAMGMGAAVIAAADAAQANDASHICQVCGYTSRDVLPVKCPVCSAGPERFVTIDRRTAEQIALGEGGVEEETTFDGVKLKWTEEAKKLLWTVQDGYIRRRTKARIEKKARVQGLTTITKEFALPVIAEAQEDATVEAVASMPKNPAPAAPSPNGNGQAGGNGNGKKPMAGTGATPFVWTETAVERLNRVPEGFMRNITKGKIETVAASQGATKITREIVEAGLDEAKQMMNEAMVKYATPAGREEVRAMKTEYEIPVGDINPSGHAVVATDIALLTVPVKPDTDFIWNEVAMKRLDEVEVKVAEHGKGEPEKARAMSQALTEERAREQKVGEITGAFMETLGKKIGYGHPLADVTYEHEFTWTPEAEARLASVPDFCREMARWRVEWTAVKQNLGYTITPEIMDVKYEMWDDVSKRIMEKGAAMPWDPATEARLAKVPDFVKGQVVQSVEGHARALGYNRVNDEVLDKTIDKWMATGDFHEGKFGYKA